MIDKEKQKKIKEIATEVGGDKWGLLAEAVNDDSFNSILGNQESNILSQLRDNPNTIRNYRDIFVGIVAKYLIWKTYQESGLDKINKEIEKLSQKINSSNEQLEIIKNTAEHIGGTEVMATYAETFQKTSNDHKENARKENRKYFWSLVALIVITALVFFVSITDFNLIRRFIAEDINLVPYSTGFFIAKIALLFFVYQVSQFYKRNYNAEKHLQETYQHRADVLKSLHSVYNLISDEKERDKILAMGVLFAYERGETGYITTKEGAGSTDNLVEGIFSKLFNK